MGNLLKKFGDNFKETKLKKWFVFEGGGVLTKRKVILGLNLNYFQFSIVYSWKNHSNNFPSYEDYFNIHLYGGYNNLLINDDIDEIQKFRDVSIWAYLYHKFHFNFVTFIFTLEIFIYY